MNKMNKMSKKNDKRQKERTMPGRPQQTRRRIAMKYLVLFSTGIILAAAALSGCVSVTPASSGTELKKVTLVLDWVVNTNHVGIYVAQEKGYFAEEGLKVEIVQSSDLNFVEMVGSDAAQFGICGQEQLTQARTGGDVPVVAIGAILQHNTSGFASPSDRHITTPKDFEGKIYSGWGTALEEKFIANVMEKSGGDFSRVEMRMMGATDFFASMETEADFAWIYYGWDGIGAEAKDYPINFILLQDIDPMMDFYSPIFISNEKTISEDPEVVTGFMKALSKGYTDAVTDVEESCDILLKFTPETDREHAIKSVEYLSGYFLNEEGKFGVMKESVWQNFSKWMLDNKLLDKALDVTNSYTNKFLP
jgi:ABC-type nitrate/sulfonate/bicarbonate transport system substrate-binding protein